MFEFPCSELTERLYMVVGMHNWTALSSYICLTNSELSEMNR